MEGFGGSLEGFDFVWREKLRSEIILAEIWLNHWNFKGVYRRIDRYALVSINGILVQAQKYSVSGKSVTRIV